MKDSSVTRPTRTGLWGACICGVLGALTGCTSSSTAWFQNDTDTMVRVRFWCGPRETADNPATLTPGEVFDVEPGKSVTIQLDEEEGYVSPSHSIVRMQAQPLVAGFKRTIHYWFEINPPGPYGVKAIGVQPDIRAERDGTGTMLRVPAEHWPAQPETN